MMRSRLRVLLVLSLIPALCIAQNPTNGGPVYPESGKPQSAPVQSAPSEPVHSNSAPSAPPPAAAAPVPVKHSAEGFPILEDGTPVRLSLARSLSSAESRVGDRVDFKVVDPVVLDGVTVVPKGALAWGKIAEAKRKRRLARGGKLAIEIDSVQLANSTRVRLRAVREAKGGEHTGLMSGAMVGTAIVFLPIAPVWLLMHGKEAKIPEGTEITAYVNGDFTYPEHPAGAPANTAPAVPAATAAAPATPAPPPPAPAGTAPQPAEAAPEPAAPDSSYGSDAAMEAAPVSTEIAFTSSPDGAEIELDGRFMGNTPSTIGVPGSGEHTVRISKRGYRPYEKRVHTSGGSITLHADLQSER